MQWLVGEMGNCGGTRARITPRARWGVSTVVLCAGAVGGTDISRAHLAGKGGGSTTQLRITVSVENAVGRATSTWGGCCLQDVEACADNSRG